MAYESWWVGLEMGTRRLDLIQGPQSEVNFKNPEVKNRYSHLIGPLSDKRTAKKIQEALHTVLIGANPPKRFTPPVIYDRILSITAKKGPKSNWPNEEFIHKFGKSKSKIYGLPDGSLLIKGPKRLWKRFEYNT